jgi:hypothetical protein
MGKIVYVVTNLATVGYGADKKLLVYRQKYRRA